tara:strand:- start:532 stop:1602 length:1071 start_codon:yes stop_codon:yes gene_type:complete
MELAARMAERAQGLTSPNPPVGAIIVKNGIILSRGFTQAGGKPHAEIDAINKVKNKQNLEGAEMYVTLEPCFHTGKTKPCVDKLLKYKFAKIYYADVDKNPLVNGKSIKKLRGNGVKAYHCNIKDRAFNLNNIFFNKLLSNKPYVTLKIATTNDNMIAHKNLKEKWITNQLSRNFSHHLRAKSDCLLVGSGTVIKDNPLLNCRISGLEKSTPDLFILDRNLILKEKLKIFKIKNRKIFIFYNNKKAKKLNSLPGIRYIYIKQVNERLDLNQVLNKIAKMGYNSVLIEGGRKLNTSLFQEDAIDQLFWFKSVKKYGKNGIFAIEGQNSTMKNFIRKFKLISKQNLSDDTLKTYLRIN